MKTVLNDEEGISKISFVKKLRNLKKKVNFFYFLREIFFSISKSIIGNVASMFSVSLLLGLFHCSF